MIDYKKTHKQAYTPASDEISEGESLLQMIACGLLMGAMLTGLMWYALIQATGGF